ncbi:MAG TPA: LPS export ABC transporter periplasmic protein LptC [Candidatus Aquabacterium excrementipullorum]|nr:LPS export ABC transporter periplasmic protein LptC [Candidatus Aquabacterium excrementipullorum]
MKLSRTLTQAIDQVRSAVPIVVLGGLAAYTWWLVQSVPSGDDAARAAVPPSIPDYVLADGLVERFDATGRRISVLRGKTMKHFPEGDRMVVSDLHVVAQDEQGQHVTARALEGLYQGDDAVVNLLGQAHVVATPVAPNQARGPIVFDGEEFTLYTDARRVVSKKPVRVTSPEGVVNGSSLDYDAATGLTQLGGRVSGRLQQNRAVQP